MKTPDTTKQDAPAAPAIDKPKRIELQLRCTFTKDELLEKGKRAAELTQELAQVEAEFDTAKENFKSRISALEAQRGQQLQHIGAGYEHRFVACVVVFDKPDKGRKMTTRTDTNEVVSVEQMTAAEMQREFALGVTVAGDGNVGVPSDGPAEPERN